MIRCDSMKDMGDGTFRVELFSDTKEEVTDTPTDVVGMPDGTKIAMESTVLTANGEVAFMKSTGEWNWLGGE